MKIQIGCNVPQQPISMILVEREAPAEIAEIAERRRHETVRKRLAEHYRSARLPGWTCPVARVVSAWCEKRVCGVGSSA